MTLLVVGAVITSFLIPQLTASWQINEKELDLKYRLAQQLNVPVENFTRIMGLYHVVFDEGFSRFYNESYKKAILNETLEGGYKVYHLCFDMKATLSVYYSPNNAIPKNWNDICFGMRDYARLISTSEGWYRKLLAKEVLNDLNLPENSVDIGEVANRTSSGWNDMSGLFLDEKQKVIEEVINSHVRGYDKNIFQWKL